MEVGVGGYVGRRRSSWQRRDYLVQRRVLCRYLGAAVLVAPPRFTCVLLLLVPCTLPTGTLVGGRANGPGLVVSHGTDAPHVCRSMLDTDVDDDSGCICDVMLGEWRDGHVITVVRWGEGGDCSLRRPLTCLCECVVSWSRHGQPILPLVPLSHVVLTCSTRCHRWWTL